MDVPSQEERTSLGACCLGQQVGKLGLYNGVFKLPVLVKLLQSQLKRNKNSRSEAPASAFAKVSAE